MIDQFKPEGKRYDESFINAIPDTPPGKGPAKEDGVIRVREPLTGAFHPELYHDLLT